LASIHVFKGLDAAQAIKTAEVTSSASAKSIQCPTVTSTAIEHMLCYMATAGPPTAGTFAATALTGWTYRSDSGATAATVVNAMYDAEVANATTLTATSSGNIYSGFTAMVRASMGFATDQTAPTVSSVNSSTANG